MPFFRISNVTRPPSRKLIVREMGISWQSGERIGLTGPSGCGKTTLLRSLVAGGVAGGLMGSVESDLSSQMRIAYAPQRDGLLPWFTLRRQLSDWVSTCGTSVGDMREVLAEVHLNRQLDQFPDELSGGEYQRAVIARSLLTNADVHLLDEPCVAVDISLRWKVLKAWSDRIETYRASAIIVAHEVDVLAFLCDRVIVVGGATPREVVVGRKSADFVSASCARWFLDARAAIVAATQEPSMNEVQ